MTYLLNAFSLLVEIAFDALATLFVLRLLAEAGRADFRNPVSQFVYRYTNPLLAPIRRVLPNWRRINLAALLVCYLVMLLKRLVLFALIGALPHVGGLLVLALADLLDFVLLFYLVLVFGWSLLSMFQVSPYHPVLQLVEAIVDPLLRPLRGKLVVGMLDFSPAVVMIVLLLARILVAAPLFDWGSQLARGF
ncbi:MAG TPA: YggT family protein [Frateuria sp.]|uniref:YggT family protein n=1 Tax=Frateuria sp. TaxID=2211372 RepID=UPI002DE7D862|nr:YggT family protein [Frateuria sp.]